MVSNKSVRSACLVVAVASAVIGSAQQGSTVRASLSSTGQQGTEDCDVCAVSGNGRYVVFHSRSTNLVPDDTNATRDVFVRDRQTGQTTRVSVGPAGAQANGSSGYPSISGDGRYVAFESVATNLVPGDTNGVGDSFVHDRTTGETTRISLSSIGAQSDNHCNVPQISSNGRYVVFWSMATNLVGGDANGVGDDFVHDRTTGQTSRISVASGGGEGNGQASTDISVSANGQSIAFVSSATNLVSADTNASRDVFVYDAGTGQTARVSVSSAGVQGNGHSDSPSVSADGRYVAFHSNATNLATGDTNGSSRDVFLHDRQTGQTVLVSVNSSGGAGNAGSETPSISGDGRTIAFVSLATNLVTGDTNGQSDVFVHDRQTAETKRVSVTSSGGQGNSFSFDPVFSSDGRYVAFWSASTNLVSGDTNGKRDVFTHQVLPGKPLWPVPIGP